MQSNKVTIELNDNLCKCWTSSSDKIRRDIEQMKSEIGNMSDNILMAQREEAKDKGQLLMKLEVVFAQYKTASPEKETYSPFAISLCAI